MGEKHEVERPYKGERRRIRTIIVPSGAVVYNDPDPFSGSLIGEIGDLVGSGGEQIKLPWTGIRRESKKTGGYTWFCVTWGSNGRGISQFGWIPRIEAEAFLGVNGQKLEVEREKVRVRPRPEGQYEMVFPGIPPLPKLVKRK